MFLRFRWPTYPQWGLLASAASLSGLTIAITGFGWLQSMELFALDQFFRLRPAEAVDSRLLIITLDEPDINYVGQWPMPDKTLARLLRQVVDAEPRAVGLDMYRNLPVGQGQDELIEIFQNTPVLVGVEKVVGQPIGPPPGLDPEHQVGMTDLVLDHDGTVRRALLIVKAEEGKYKYGLATKLAFNYLAQEQIYPRLIDEHRLQLGKARLKRLQSHDGGYANADAGGSQMLINFPSGQTSFETVSVTAVLEGQVSAAQMKDRIVLIGATANSLNDFFYTPITQAEEMPGVFVHAHIVSQLLRAALDGRPVLHGIPQWGEWLWIVLATHGAGGLIYVFIQRRQAYRRPHLLTVIWLLPCLGMGVTALSFGLFTMGLWVPVVAPLVSISLLAVLLLLQQNQQLQGLAAFDQLTQIPNRRSFDQCIGDIITQQTPFTLVLCDVDYFKRYNDTYGHQAGDRCLAAIAKTLNRGVRQSDLAARYGGEEFALVLRGTSSAVARDILTRIQEAVSALKILHESSDVSELVTLSFGVAIVEDMRDVTAKSLIEQADK
ncbi:MAG: CHASE2 domain-containing protein, partial [Cyanobacteria bacterium J06633_2]